jgi:hypothetical protein
MQYSTSHESVGNQVAWDGGSGLVLPLTNDGNGMENGKLSSVGEKVPCGGQERTTGDETRSLLATSESIPLTEAVTLTLPRSYKQIRASDIGQLYAACTNNKALN